MKILNGVCNCKKYLTIFVRKLERQCQFSHFAERGNNCKKFYPFFVGKNKNFYICRSFYFLTFKPNKQNGNIGTKY